MFLDSVVKGRIEKEEQRDSNLKSILKTISWRIVGTVDTIMISYFITGEAGLALSIGSVEVFSKIVLYYFHERVWSSVKLKK
ncbi:DUF2061 domain-containing protein [Roseivirga seohaensis]|mgnify:CR=1 FL=1|uniref:DUF2061 domain-containing protein n=2 Tax=Roseivirga seohaensis TaxID=1914963 RepID=A0A0L8AHC4_9BACT|nr:DUF2061 domain-containing protein [Roseivirga seohaensis]KOF01809.1 hypothetical protein OB69_15850 [Roseivirga seohaensis subsp. aquiponti]KYG85365.1 hypothetical protein AWW67_16385 [Roseivirga seohaensis]